MEKSRWLTLSHLDQAWSIVIRLPRRPRYRPLRERIERDRIGVVITWSLFKTAFEMYFNDYIAFF